MPDRPDSPAAVARIAVLGCLVRGRSFAYAGRNAAVSIDQVRQIADAAGWPDVAAVKAMWEELRAIPTGRPKEAPSNPAAKPDTPQVEREYRGEVVQAGPTPEHLEPLESYVARFRGPLPGDPGYVSQPLPPEEAARLEQVIEEALAERTAQVGGAWIQVEEPLPPTTDSPDVTLADVTQVVAAVAAYKEATLPCEVCGVAVLKSFADRTGRQRHAGHPEGS